MRINVTAEHIEKGNPRSAKSCPVALALLGALPDAKDITVGSSFCTIDNKPYMLGFGIGKIIGKFDNTREMFPFSVEMNEFDLTLVE